MLDAVPYGLIVVSQSRELMFANSAALDAFGAAGGTSLEQLRGVFVLVDPFTERPLLPDLSPISRALRGEEVESREYMIRRTQGGPADWIECSASPVRDQQGAITAAVFTFRGIAARKQKEHELESSSRFRDFVYHENLAGIFHTTVDGRIVDCNDAILRMLRYNSKAELFAIRAHQLYCNPLERDRVLRELAKPGGVKEYEIELWRKDGTRCWALCNVRLLQPFPGEVGGSMIATLIDITDRKAWEENLRKSEQRFAAFMRHLPGVAFIKDLEGRYVYYNDASASLFGKRPDEIVGKTDEDVWPSDLASRYRQNDERVIAEVHHAEFVETVQHTDGPHEWLIYKFPIVENGVVNLVGGVGIDITERHQMEQKLLQSRKIEALGMLAGGVAHDFNNLLTVISGYGQLALESLGDDPEPRLAECLRRILDGAARASGIAGQLLAFSRRERIKPVVLDLTEVLRGMEELLRTMVGEHVSLRIRTDANECLILSDQNQIQQVVINLASNARDAMPLGGEIEIRCRRLSEPVNNASGTPLEILLEVVDNGVGMDEETIRKIFDPFYTSKGSGKGTGLGLSTVDGIVTQSGGLIEVESTLHEGSTFRVYLPAAEGTKQVAGVPRKAKESRGERVLLVEDDSAVRSLTKAVLGRHGYRVMEAESGPAALQIWDREQGGFDLLLTDVVMPEMSGGELAIKLRERNPHLKVLFMSGYAGDMLSRNGVLEGQTQLIAKPFSPEGLRSKLRDVLDA